MPNDENEMRPEFEQDVAPLVDAESEKANDEDTEPESSKAFANAKSSQSKVDTSNNTQKHGAHHSLTDPKAPKPEDELDGRNRYDWKSRYPTNATREIRLESGLLIFILLCGLFLLFLTWSGVLSNFLGNAFIVKGSTGRQQILDATLKRYMYFLISGLIGGTIFGIKYFYRIVARGFWNQDRVYWRIMSPLVSAVVAFIIGTLINASYVHMDKPLTARVNSSGTL